MELSELPGLKHIPRQLRQLTRRHDQIIQLHVINISNKDIATILGITPRTVQTTIYSDLAKDRIIELKRLAELDTADIAVQIHIGATRAIKFLNEVISGTGEGAGASKGLRFKAAVEALRMDGYTPITRSINLQARGVLGEDGMMALINKGRAVKEADISISETISTTEPMEADFTELIPEGS